MTRLPQPGLGRPYHPAQFREPPSERALEQARAAARRLGGRPRLLGLRRSARKGGRF